MKKNVVLILGIVFTAAGLIPILIGVTFFLSHYNFISNAARTTAVVTDIKSYRDFDGDKHYEVVIKYSVERRRILRNYCTLPFDVCRQGNHRLL